MCLRHECAEKQKNSGRIKNKLSTVVTSGEWAAEGECSWSTFTFLSEFFSTGPWCLYQSFTPLTQLLDSFSNYVMNTCYGLGVVLDAGDTKVSQTGHKASRKTHFLVRNKQESLSHADEEAVSRKTKKGKQLWSGT